MMPLGFGNQTLPFLKHKQQERWNSFIPDMNNACTLKLIFSSQELKINILDVTMSIKNNLIEFKTFQKKLNTHQIIISNSAHPKACLKGLIFGSLICLYKQNTKEDDFNNISQEFHMHIRRLGYTHKQINPIFIKAGKKLSSIDKNLQKRKVLTLKRQKASSFTKNTNLKASAKKFTKVSYQHAI